VIGFSGLSNSVPFKKRELPGLTPREYRIAQGFDSAAAIVDDDGVLAAAAQERFSGEKATGSFPVDAIGYCLRRAGIDIGAVDYLAHGFAYRPGPAHEHDELSRRRFREVYSRQAQLDLLGEFYPGVDWDSRLVEVPHHLAHAASSFHVSGFEDALVLVADGMGETESMTVAVGSRGKLDVLRTVPAMHSLGILYSIFTLYLGFDIAMDEYKVMGLASFGNPRRYLDEIMEIIQIGEHGNFRIPILLADQTSYEMETHDGVLRELAARFGPPRQPGAAVQQRHRDLAAALQAGLETCVLHVLEHFRAQTGLRRLAMAGGTALNCTMNGRILRSGLFDDVFVQPAAGDDGTALGAALFVRAQQLPERTLPALTMPYSGPDYDDQEIGAVLARYPDATAQRFDDVDELVSAVSGLIADGRIIAWFQGRMEFGPRALGNRSILADPREGAMRDRLNALVKRREDFRPFAPAVTIEDAGVYFEIPEGRAETFRHMLFVTSTRPEWRDGLGAVTHTDGTARVQTVRRADNDRFYRLLRAFEQRAGVPVLLNTSFNLRGQPIVRDPATAVETYLNSALDHLVIGDHLVSRTP
jgi:carbamoyltransferase